MTTIEHETRCLADRACYGECIHDAVTGKRIEPVEITRTLTPSGVMTYMRLRKQQIIVSDPA